MFLVVAFNWCHFQLEVSYKHMESRINSCQITKCGMNKKEKKSKKSVIWFDKKNLYAKVSY